MADERPINYNTYQTINGARHDIGPDQPSYWLIDGVRHELFPLSGDLRGNDPAVGNAGSLSPAPAPPQFRFTFDTIGQVIFRSIGHCRLPLRPIWAQGINESGDVSISNTQTAAYAVCAPIDPLEEIDILSLWAGGSAIFGAGGVITPPGWSPADAALLAASLAAIVIYPGDESQLPAPLIVADKGTDKTNAFRGIRYIIIPNYPIGAGGGGSGDGLPQLSVGITRTNPGGEPAEDSGAVEFLAGAT